jgi:hypothetical protein
MARIKKPDRLSNHEIRSAIGRYLAASYDLTRPLPERLRTLLSQFEQEMAKLNNTESFAAARSGLNNSSRALGSRTVASARTVGDGDLGSRAAGLGPSNAPAPVPQNVRLHASVAMLSARTSGEPSRSGPDQSRFPSTSLPSAPRSLSPTTTAVTGGLTLIGLLAVCARRADRSRPRTSRARRP